MLLKALIPAILIPVFSFCQRDTFLLDQVANPALKEYNLRKMTVDSRGNLWFATDKGLIKYDGNDITLLEHSDTDFNTLSVNSLGSIFLDRNDNIYAFGVPTAIDYVNTKTGKVSRLKIRLRPEDEGKRGFPFAFYNVDVDNDSNLWISMFNVGFLKYDLKTSLTEYFAIPRTHSFQTGTVYNVKSDPSDPNILWLGTDDGIYSFNKKDKKLSRNFHAFSKEDSSYLDLFIYNIDPLPGDTIWFTMETWGFGSYNKKTGQYRIYYDKNVSTGKRQHQIIHINLIQRKGNDEYYFSNEDGLPGIFNKQTGTYKNNIRIREAYPSVQQKQFMKDEKGNLWSLVFYQLYRATDNTGSLRNRIIPPKRSVLNQIAPFKKALWDSVNSQYYLLFDYRTDLLVYDQNMNLKGQIPFTSGLNDYEVCVRDGIINRNGQLWICGSLVWYHDRLTNRMKPVETTVDFSRMGLQSISMDGDYLLLQPSRPSFNAVYRVHMPTQRVDSISLPSVVRHEKTIMNQQGKQMDVLHRSVDGKNYYLCYGMNLFQLDATLNNARSVRVFPNDKDVKGFQHYYNMWWYLTDAKNRLWVTTLEGIAIYDPVSLEVVKRIPAAKNTYPLSIFHDDHNRLMCYMYSEGVIIYDYMNEREYKLTLSDGIATIFNSGISIANNTLFIGALEYFHYLGIESIININNRRNCYLSRISVFNKPFSTDTLPAFLNVLKLKHNENYVSFTFSALEFDQPERLVYRYKLSEVDPDWVEANYLSRTATYNNLRPGKYNFMVNVRNKDGTWSDEGVDLLVTIVPAWWQTNLFRISMLLLAALLIYLLVRWRIRSVRKQEQVKIRYEKELLELEAKALQAQMNPHFIFNSLNSIKSLIQKGDNEKAADYLTTFSKLIRTLFQNSDKREISLHDEIETCKLYTQLEKMRFDDKVDFFFRIDESLDLKSIRVPALIIQPFIENAIWHGLMPIDKGGRVIVSVRGTNEDVECIIDDNGVGRELSARYKSQYRALHESKGIGLTKSRLQLDRLLNEREDTISIIDKHDESGTGTGTTIILRFKEKTS